MPDRRQQTNREPDKNRNQQNANQNRSRNKPSDSNNYGQNYGARQKPESQESWTDDQERRGQNFQSSDEYRDRNREPQYSEDERYNLGRGSNARGLHGDLGHDEDSRNERKTQSRTSQRDQFEEDHNEDDDLLMSPADFQEEDMDDNENERDRDRQPRMTASNRNRSFKGSDEEFHDEFMDTSSDSEDEEDDAVRGQYPSRNRQGNRQPPSRNNKENSNKPRNQKR